MLFKLRSSKLWLFLEFDCLKYYNGNGNVRKVFNEKSSVTTILTVYNQGNADTSMLTVHNQGKDLD